MTINKASNAYYYHPACPLKDRLVCPKKFGCMKKLKFLLLENEIEVRIIMGVLSMLFCFVYGLQNLHRGPQTFRWNGRKIRSITIHWCEVLVGPLD